MRIKVKAGVPMKMDADDNRTFDQWCRSVDKFLLSYAGATLSDLPDCRYRDWYDDRVRPIRAANRALRYAGGE